MIKKTIFIFLASLIIFPVLALAADPTAILAGRVIDLAANKPITGAYITLQPTANGSGTQTYYASSDVNGNYVIRNILRYTSDGKLVTYRLYVNVAFYAQFISQAISFQYRIIQAVDAGLSNAPLTGNLTGRVFDGLLANTNNTGIAGAKVTIKPTIYGYGTHDYSATTGNNGEYAIPAIIRFTYSSGGAQYPTVYQLYLTVPGYPETLYETLSFNNLPNQDCSVPFVRPEDIQRQKAR